MSLMPWIYPFSHLFLDPTPEPQLSCICHPSILISNLPLHSPIHQPTLPLPLESLILLHRRPIVPLKRPLHHLPPRLPNILTTPPLPISSNLLIPRPFQNSSFLLLITHKAPISPDAPPELSPFITTAPQTAVPVDVGELPTERSAVEGGVEGGAAG